MSKKLTLHIPDELHRRLKMEAVKRDTSMTRIVVKAIVAALKREKK